MFIEFVKRMLKWRPEERSTARELLNDPWLYAEFDELTMHQYKDFLLGFLWKERGEKESVRKKVKRRVHLYIRIPKQ